MDYEKRKELKFKKPHMSPARGRFLCKMIPAESVELAEGLGGKKITYDPAKIRNPKTNESFEIGRFIVIAAGIPEGTNDYVYVDEGEDEHGNRKFRPVRPGDELYWFIPASAVAADLNTIFDHETAQQYIMFHHTELAGAAPFLKPEDIFWE